MQEEKVAIIVTISHFTWCF